MGARKIIEVPVTLEVPVGPQHPALHEPLLLKVYAEGEEVVKVEVNTGYNHRGIEKLCERDSFYKNVFIIGRVCGICNAVHTDCYVRALEHLLGFEPCRRALYLRALAMELERIHSHMLANAVLALNVGFENLFMNVMLDRELVMKAKEVLTGARVMADYIMVGGVRRDLDPVKREKVLRLLNALVPKLEYYKRVFEEDETVLKRTVEVGKVSRLEAIRHSLLGPVARASGVAIDARASERYGAYSELDFSVVVRDEGDTWARAMVRWDEALEAARIAQQVLEKLPSDGNPVPDERRSARVFPAGEAYTRVEAPRGELTYYVVSDGRGPKPYRVKIRTPSFNNIVNSPFIFVGYSVADLPAILASLDPCISCMERVTVIDVEKGVRRSVALRELAVVSGG